MRPRSLYDPAGRRSILERLTALTPDCRRGWGKMDPAQLLPHLASGLRMALGERKVEGRTPGRVRGAIWRYLAIHRLPWPEGRIQAPPGAFSTPSAGWARDRDILLELIERFAAAPPDALAQTHPTFGRMRPHDWDVLQYRHLDHHLRQFGM